jgi:indolepyruvate ferredoxin oxidoreductase
MLDADHISPALRSRLERRLADRLAPPEPPPRDLIPLTVNRTPFFCSGCPHNWGTKVPEGAVVGMGTGCHGMTLLMDEDRVGESIGITAMGNEGAHWIGMAPFVDTPHVFQNLGDGTYFHSAQLAVQAAIGAGTNITFKLLYNDTVAMTGGQDTSFRVGTVELAQILLLQGAREVVITADDLGRYRGRPLPDGVEVRDRTEIVAIQQRLAAVPGVTVLIHDQACAAELRRARTRGTLARPTTRVVINHRICEGCGDCGDVSNCLSVQPVDTPLGRKTRIDQASCNVDLSCLGGDCPAFMTVEVDGVADAGIETPPPIPEPSPAELTALTVRMAGIGGTGVVTVAQVLGTAAMLAGLEVDGLDQTGLSQKAGPVISDLGITAPDTPRRTNLVGLGQADVVLAFDLLVAASDGAIGAGLPDHTRVVASTTTSPTGRQITRPSLAAPTADDLLERLAHRSDAGHHVALDATAIAAGLVGSAAVANVVVLGAALQSGAIPIPLDTVETALRLNGVAVERNLAALAWGRCWVADRGAVDAALERRSSPTTRVDTDPLPAPLAGRVDRLDASVGVVVGMLAADLVAYQDRSYAARFLDLVERAAALGDGGLTEAVARGYHHLLAYKDEYEVARLMLAPDGLAEAAAVTGRADPEVTWHLHPPIARALGLDRKLRFTGRTAPAFRLLARGKRLRGTWADPFGRAALRRTERELPGEYAAAIERVLAAVRGSAITVDRARQIAALPDQVRGFEDLKTRRIEEYRAALTAALTEIP